MTGIVVEGNEIRNCRLGQSEALVLNGNVDGFLVIGNIVHDNDNIGIDFIGFEGTGPVGLDQARNGICADNVVYNISSATNPTYGGDRSAGGIYVDGGRDIVIERNRIDNCDIGIEVASEHFGKATSHITVRNNFISRGYLGNVLLGGYAANRGGPRIGVSGEVTLPRGVAMSVAVRAPRSDSGRVDEQTLEVPIVRPGVAWYASERVVEGRSPQHAWVFVRFTAGGVREVSAEHVVGHCVQIPG